MDKLIKHGDYFIATDVAKEGHPDYNVTIVFTEKDGIINTLTTMVTRDLEQHEKNVQAMKDYYN